MGKKSKRRRGSTPLFEAKHGATYCRKRKLCAECGAKLTGRQQRWCSKICVNAYLIRADPQVARQNVYARDKGVCVFCKLDTDALREKIKAADRTAFKEFLDGENRRRPKGYMRDVSRPDRWAHMDYARCHGPWTYVGRSPGGSWANVEGRPGLKELVKRYRLVVLEGSGFETHWWRKTFWDMDHVLEVSRGGGECGLGNLRTLCVVCHVKRSARRTTQLVKKRRKAKRIPKKPGEACRALPGACAGPDPCRPCRRYRARVFGYAVPHSG